MSDHRKRQTQAYVFTEETESLRKVWVASLTFSPENEMLHSKREPSSPLWLMLQIYFHGTWFMIILVL